MRKESMQLHDFNTVQGQDVKVSFEIRACNESHIH